MANAVRLSGAKPKPNSLQIAALNPRLNALVQVDADHFEEEVRAAAMAPDALVKQVSTEVIETVKSDKDIQAGIGWKAKVEALPAPGVLPDIQAAIDYAAQTLGTSGKVGVVGFCMGGGFALQLVNKG